MVCHFHVQRVSGLTRSPFGQTSARFKANRNALEIPGTQCTCIFIHVINAMLSIPNEGPGSYNNDKVTCLAGEALKKAT